MILNAGLGSNMHILLEKIANFQHDIKYSIC